MTTTEQDFVPGGTSSAIDPNDFAAVSARYKQLNAAREAEQAQQRRRDREAAQRRRALEPEFWRHRQVTAAERGYATKASQAWSRFAEAVLNAGDTVTAWLDYRRACAVAEEDDLATRQYHYLRERDERAEARKEYDWIAREIGVLPSLHPVTGSTFSALPQPEYDARLKEFNRRLSAYEGKARRPLTPPPVDRQLVEPPLEQDPIPPQSYANSITSYAQAIDTVTRDAEARAVQQAKAQRDQDREDFLAARQ